jgi:hypothetical protein
MFKAIFSLFLSLISLNSIAQLNVSPNILAPPFQGQRLTAKADNDIAGTPFLYNNWKRGSIIMTDGNSFLVPKINFDASRSLFVFDHSDTLYDLDDNVKSVVIYPDANSNNGDLPQTFINVGLGNSSPSVEVLTNGKITIVRKFTKRPEGENYSNGILKTSREYVLKSQDFVMINNQLKLIKYSTADLEELVADKVNEINSFVKSNNLKPKKQTDFLKSIEYYNSLH